MKKIALLFSLFIFNYSVAQVKPAMQKIVADDRSEADCFGWSTSIHGDLAIIGSVSKNQVLNEAILKEAGAAYVFRREATGKWVQMKKLESDVIRADNFFGGSVGIYTPFAVVGACGEDDGKEENANARMGIVHLYGVKGDKWNRIQKLELSKRTKQDNFGYAVSISDKFIAVGCPGRNLKDNNFTDPCGAVYIYEMTLKSGWVPFQEIVAPQTSGFYFGRTVSISGSNLVVGTANGGPVSIFELEKNRWVLKQTLKANDVKDVGYGTSLAVFNNRLIIGADGDYDPFEGFERPKTDSVMEVMHEEANGQFSKVLVPNNAKLRDSFGIKPDQFKAMAKAVESVESRKKRLAGAGGVYIYKRNVEGAWNLEERIVPKGIAADDHFGASVSLSDSLAVIGAVGDKLKKGAKDDFYGGAVYVFKLNKDGKWIEKNKITATKRASLSRFGASTGVWQNRILIGSRFETTNETEKDAKPNSGAAYIKELK